MFSTTYNLKIHIAPGLTDMRKSIDGLSILVSEKLKSKFSTSRLKGKRSKKIKN